MRPSCAVLLAVFALVAHVKPCVGTQSTMANANLSFNNYARTDDLYGIRNTRLLRAEKATEYDGEERALDWLKKVTNLLKPKNSAKVVPVEATEVLLTRKFRNQVTKLVKSSDTTDDVFAKTKLGGLPSQKELFKPNRLPMYISFSERSFDRRRHDKWGIETLLKNYREEELAMIANIGFRNGDDLSKQTAEGLRSGLISKWLDEGKPARAVAQLLKGGRPTMEKFNSGAYDSYLHQFNDKYITKAVSA
ncbi:Avirulence protein (Avh) [Phytophthora palmivora]|uniref:Avirulence protein (Avh) n=1 Tax=Phytophthora palmivora TaxID=4796 RepID=A0A2P4X3H2_9STRA|nr:Avirulence protein (Avh) [Phytophthora palmivora]